MNIIMQLLLSDSYFYFIEMIGRQSIHMNYLILQNNGDRHIYRVSGKRTIMSVANYLYGSNQKQEMREADPQFSEAEM